MPEIKKKGAVPGALVLTFGMLLNLPPLLATSWNYLADWSANHSGGWFPPDVIARLNPMAGFWGLLLGIPLAALSFVLSVGYVGARRRTLGAGFRRAFILNASLSVVACIAVVATWRQFSR